MSVCLSIMPLSHVVILAIVQGLTEFLPISSSAHLALAPWLLGWPDPGLEFDIALHFGTLLAVVLYFFRDWIQIAAQGFGLSWGSDPELRQQPRMLWMLAAATVPVGVAGVLLKNAAETILRSPVVIGVMLILVGLLMWYAERVGARSKTMGNVSFGDSMVVGAAQALAIVPGTSRSGITIVAGLFRDMDRTTSARFSFLLSTPAIAGAALVAFHDLRKAGGLSPEMQTAFLLGSAVSAVSGCLVIGLFLRFLRRFTLKFFVYYRVIFGIIVLALAFFRLAAA